VLVAPACGQAACDEDFSSGKYNLHVYATFIRGGTETRLTLTRQLGAWQPALLLIDSGGRVLFDGALGLQAAGLSVTAVADGRNGATASFVIRAASSLDAQLFVTGWAVVDSDFAAALPKDAEYHLEIDERCGPPTGDGIAPAGALANEQLLSGPLAVAVTAASGPAYRVDAAAGEHLGFRLDFRPTSAAVTLELLRWHQGAAVSLAITDDGPGFRVLAGLDAEAARTYWVRLGGASASGTLSVTRTPFEEGARCDTDCDRLLQLPVPNGPDQGYDNAPGAAYRYQFGRRDLLMFTRHAGRVMRSTGVDPFLIQDLSNWDGTQPPGHLSHDLGKDVDYSIYNQAGESVWGSFCQGTADYECVPGSGRDFGAEHMARLLAAVFESRRAVYAFLDREFHAALFAAAQQLADSGEIDSDLVSVFHDVVAHWPNHYNHVHFRVSLDPY
jgi:hypothetical protein